jgi:hypothetical protein
MAVVRPAAALDVAAGRAAADGGAALAGDARCAADAGVGGAAVACLHRRPDQRQRPHGRRDPDRRCGDRSALAAAASAGDRSGIAGCRREHDPDPDRLPQRGARAGRRRTGAARRGRPQLRLAVLRQQRPALGRRHAGRLSGADLRAAVAAPPRCDHRTGGPGLVFLGAAQRLLPDRGRAGRRRPVARCAVLRRQRRLRGGDDAGAAAHGRAQQQPRVSWRRAGTPRRTSTVCGCRA